MAWLLNPETKEREYLAERSMVGRTERCWVRIPHGSVSKEHAMVFFDGTGWFVRDLGSRNGTWANGTRLEPGASVSIGKDSTLQFGDISAVLSTTEPPTLCVRSETDACQVADGGVLSLPDEETPLASIYEPIPGRWVMELEGQERPLQDADTFYVGQQRYRVHVPTADSRRAYQSTQQSQRQLVLAEVQLELEVSLDGESIVTRLLTPSGTLELPSRNSHQVLLVLARQRIADEAGGVTEAECGWVYADDFAKMLGFDRERVNVDIHRLRQQFANAGVSDASRVIERRPTAHQLRIGVRRVAIV